MKKHNKDLSFLLLQPDHYMLKTSNIRGRPVFKIYDKIKAPVQYFSEKQVAKYGDVFKKDDAGRITFNFNKVRQMNGNTFIKRLYKKYRCHGNK